MEPRYHIYILCLTNNYFNDKFHQDNRFELSVVESVDYAKILSSAARWVHIEDIEDLNKIEPERPPKKKIQ